MKAAALAFVQRNIAVFPCQPRGKLPLTEHGCRDATMDVRQIESWWQRWPEANIGIATGAASRIFVLDVDTKHGKNGEASLKAIEERVGQELPCTVEAITPSGRHLYFGLPDSAPRIKNSVSAIGEGLDIRSEGGYVVAPPSVAGRPYCWSVDSSSSFAEPPPWFLQLLCPPPDELDRRRPAEHWMHIVKHGAQEGTRNNTATSLAGHLLRLGERPDTVLELLHCWNAARNRPPLPDAEIETVVISIAEAEMARRQRR